MSPGNNTVNEEKGDNNAAMTDERADTTGHGQPPLPLTSHYNDTGSNPDPQEPRQGVSAEDEQGLHQAEEVVDGDGDKDDTENNGDGDDSDADSWDSEYDLWYGDGDGRPGRARPPAVPSTSNREVPVQDDGEEEVEYEDDDEDITLSYFSCSSSDDVGPSAATSFRHRSSDRRHDPGPSREPDGLASYPIANTRDRLYHIPYADSYDISYLTSKDSHETPTYTNSYDTTRASPNDNANNPPSSASHKLDTPFSNNTPSIDPFDNTNDYSFRTHNDIYGLYDCPYADLYGDLDGDTELDPDEWFQRVYFPDPQTLPPRAQQTDFPIPPIMSAAVEEARRRFWSSRNNERTLPIHPSRRYPGRDTNIADLYEFDDSDQVNAEVGWESLSNVAHANRFYDYEKRATRRALSRGTYPLDEPLVDEYASDREPDPEVWEDYFEALSEASLAEDMWSTHDSADISTAASDLASELDAIQFLTPFTTQSPPPIDETLFDEDDDSESYLDDDLDSDYDYAGEYDAQLVPGESLIEFTS